MTEREEFTGRLQREAFAGYPPCATSSVTALPFPIPPQGALGLSSGAATTECEPSTLERVCVRTRLVAFKVWETKAQVDSPPPLFLPRFLHLGRSEPSVPCAILNPIVLQVEVLYYIVYTKTGVSLKSGYYMRGLRLARTRRTPILHEHQRHDSHAHETLTHVTTLAQHPSSLTWGHPHAHSTAVCSLHGGSGTIAHALTTLSRTQGSSLIAPLTHHFTDGQFCDHTRRRPISGQRKHASRSRSRPKSHRLSEPSPLVGAYHHATTARDLRARHSSRLSL